MFVEVTNGVYRLSGGIANFYLVGESGRYTLIDAGAPADWKILSGALAQLNAPLHAVEAVLLTHAHTDHTGFAEQARTEAGARVWIHEDDAESLRTGKVGARDGKMTSYLLRAEFYRTAFSLGRRGAAKMIPVKEASEFSDGEVIPVPGQPQVVHAPGHTKGSAAIFLEKRKALVTGDVLATRNPYTGRVGPQICPSGLNWDSAQAMMSLEHLPRLESGMLLPGHGEPWTGEFDEAIRLAKTAGRS